MRKPPSPPALARSLALGAALLLGGPAAAEGALLAGVTGFELAVAEAVHGGDRDGAVAAFYRERGFAPLWTSGDASGRARLEALLAAMARAGDHGLPAARFDPGALHARLAAARTPAEAGAAEIAVTQAFLDYAAALSSGLTDPARIARDVMVREVPRRDPRALLDLMASEDPVAVLRGLAPRSPEYARLMGHKARLAAAVRRGGWGPAVAADRLAPGDEGPGVVALRDRLRAMGFLGRALSPRYDAALTAAVRDFQRATGLAEDGVAGPATIRAANVPAEARMGQVLVAMERERWMNAPRGGRAIWVNLPDFSAAILDDGVETFRTRAVIGKAEAGRYTPEFSDEMTHMVVNPSWYVPRSIVVGEYLPQLRANPGAVPHLEIRDRNGRPANRGAGFSQYTARTFPYAMRQPPGPKNALGLVKFMFPNKYNIYLHDTPAKSLFDREERAFSHGCVRLHRPFDFAHALLAPQEDDPEGAFRRALDGGAERRIDLEAPVPVHIVYRTAFTDAKGGLHFRADVYGRDALVLAALRAEGVDPLRIAGAAALAEEDRAG